MRQEYGIYGHNSVTSNAMCAFSPRILWTGPWTIYHTERSIMAHSTPLAVEEHVHGETVWVAVRSRGAEWSWLTPDEAVELGRAWIEKYSRPRKRRSDASELLV